MTIDPADTVVLLTALEIEHAAVRALLRNPTRHRHPAGTIFDVGEIAGQPGKLVLAVTGAGNQAAATLAERAITEFRPRAVLFVGIAGALHNDLDLGSVVIATKVYSYHGGIDETGGFRARPDAWQADHGLEQLAREVSRTESWHTYLRNGSTPPTIYFRALAAGEVVLNSETTALADQLRTNYDDAAAIEMESAGTARAAHYNQVPFLAVRGISDKADGRKHDTDGQGWQAVAASNAAAFAVALATSALSSNVVGSVDQPVSTRHEPMQNHRPTGANAVETALRAEDGPATFTWTSLSQPVNVAWKSDRPNVWSSTERTALEVHLVPIGAAGRLEARRLERLSGELAAYGRSHGLFSQVEELRGDTRDQLVWVESTDFRSGPHGLAVQRTGQRSVWSPLPSDQMGAVLDPDDLVAHIARSLLLLVGMNVPAADDAAIAVGLDSAGMLTEGRVSDFPRSRASGFKMHKQLRLPVEDTVPWLALTNDTDDIAEEMSARLLMAFRQLR